MSMIPIYETFDEAQQQLLDEGFHALGQPAHSVNYMKHNQGIQAYTILASILDIYVRDSEGERFKRYRIMYAHITGLTN